jgi:hypothetical protein
MLHLCNIYRVNKQKKREFKFDYLDNKIKTAANKGCILVGLFGG